jgi:hypothetical protein
VQGPQLTAGGGPAGPVAGTVSSGGAHAGQRWEEAKAEVQRLWALGQQLQTEAQTKPTYTSFRETAKMAQDTFEAAEAASRQAREERMASVGPLPMTGLQLPGAPAVLEPSEQLETDCQDQVQALAVEIVNRGASARATVQRNNASNDTAYITYETTKEIHTPSQLYKTRRKLSFTTLNYISSEPTYSERSWGAHAQATY